MPEAGVDLLMVIRAPAVRVFDAFFDADLLARWWRVDHAIVAPRLFAPFALRWNPTDAVDPVLGRLGGIFHGTVMDIRPPREAFIAECYWLPPEGEAIGPMALSIACTPVGDMTEVRITQTGFEQAARWRRYYEITSAGLRHCLDELRRTLEG